MTSLSKCQALDKTFLISPQIQVSAQVCLTAWLKLSANSGKEGFLWSLLERFLERILWLLRKNFVFMFFQFLMNA